MEEEQPRQLAETFLARRPAARSRLALFVPPRGPLPRQPHQREPSAGPRFSSTEYLGTIEKSLWPIHIIEYLVLSCYKSISRWPNVGSSAVQYSMCKPITLLPRRPSRMSLK